MAKGNGFKVLYPNAAGLDIGAREIMAALPPDREGQTVRGFGTLTPELRELVAWLKANRITHVAMESTGVYWIPIYEMLVAAGMVVIVVNPRQIKQVPGRKSDVQDCQWIQSLYSVGLLRASFQPDAEMAILRTYLRQRANLIEERAKQIQYLEKALLRMNVQLGQVVSDLTGKTGLTIIRAIVGGEHRPQELAKLWNGRMKSSQEDLLSALTGHYRKEHLFVLRQALDMYDSYTQRIAECDQEVEEYLDDLQPPSDPDLPPLPPDPKIGSNCKNAPQYDARAALYPLAGVDLTAIPGINQNLLQKILSEVGLDMTRFPTVKDFCSWLGLAPHNAISGGRVLYSHILKTDNRAGQAFRLAAQAVSRGNTVYSEFYRRVRARSGTREAIVATAHKIARTFYFMLLRKEPFNQPDVNTYLQLQRDKELRRLRLKAAKLGFSLLPSEAN